MSAVKTTKLSSRGQVVIPEEIRQRLGLSTGTQFLVLGEGDVVILKTITPPSMAEFDRIVETARRQARDAELTPEDVREAIAAVRAGR